jgi:hypothetical protein
MESKWDNRLIPDTVIEVGVRLNNDKSDWLIYASGCMEYAWDVDWREESYLSFSEGTLLHIELVPHENSRRWRIKPIHTGFSFISHDIAVGDKMSDKVLLGCDIKWILYGNELTTRR